MNKVKKCCYLILIFTFFLTITGCTDDYEENCYHINYIEEYNNGYFIIDSVESLQKFYVNYCDIFGLDNIEKNSFNGFFDKNVYGFYDILDRYDSKDFFVEGKKLIFLILNENYASTLHRLVSISYREETAKIVIECKRNSNKNLNTPCVNGSCLMIIETGVNDPSFTSVEVVRINKK